MIKLEEAKNNSMSDKNFVAALTNMANSPWAKLVIGMFTSKVQEDKVA